MSPTLRHPERSEGSLFAFLFLSPSSLPLSVFIRGDFKFRAPNRARRRIVWCVKLCDRLRNGFFPAPLGFQDEFD